MGSTASLSSVGDDPPVTTQPLIPGTITDHDGETVMELLHEALFAHGLVVKDESAFALRLVADGAAVLFDVGVFTTPDGAARCLQVRSPPLLPIDVIGLLVLVESLCRVGAARFRRGKESLWGWWRWCKDHAP